MTETNNATTGGPGNDRGTPEVAYDVKINDLLRDQRFQVRSHLDKGIVDRYSAVYASEVEMPPVKAAKVNGTLILVDGWHRVAALEKLGRFTVDVEVVEATERGAFWLAASANLEHGLPLKAKELREVFRKYIKARRHYDDKGTLKSYRAIAQELGGTRKHTTVRNWMIKDFPKIAKKYGGEDETGSGGSRDVLPEPGLEATATEALHTALAAFKGVNDPTQRGEVIQLAEDVLGKMKDAGNWDYPDF